MHNGVVRASFFVFFFFFGGVFATKPVCVYSCTDKPFFCVYKRCLFCTRRFLDILSEQVDARQKQQ